MDADQVKSDRAVQQGRNILQMVVSNWKSLTPKRHKRNPLKNYQEQQLKEIPGASKKTGSVMHAALTSEVDSEDYKVNGKAMDTGMRVRNHALIHYIAKLAVSNHDNDTFDFAFVQSLLKNGADINATDKYGQTVFHEVARSWHADVAEFLIRNGANMDQQDKYGRAPLHVAAAVDYVEMVEFLVNKGANVNIRTTGEEQTPIHFAAKNDACKSLKALIAYGVDVNCRDYQERTPLQLAAAMSRSKAARMLIELGIPAGVYDKDGEMAVSLLVIKMPDVAKLALDQFYSEDNITHKRYYFLNYLEGSRVVDGRCSARTPLEAAVASNCVQIIMHPVMQCLIATKWGRFGRRWAWFDFVLNMTSAIIWTAMGVTLPLEHDTLYNPPHEKWWRMVLACLALLLTMYELLRQVVITVRTNRSLTQWKSYREKSLSRDKPFCHPQWPDEARYVDSEIKSVLEHRWLATHDRWVYIDWVALTLIIASAISHAVFFSQGTREAHTVHVRIMCALLIVTWVRILKFVRPFQGTGAFVASFTKMVGNIMLSMFLVVIIFLPYASSFWILFGGLSPVPAKGFRSMTAVMYEVFQMTVLDTNHSIIPFLKVDPFMARLLSCTYVFISFVIVLNLIIAMITDTFKRVFSYAQEHAAIERAKTILNVEDSMREKTRKQYWEYIRSNCSPVVMNRLNRHGQTIFSEMVHMNDRIRETHQLVRTRFGKEFGENKKSTMEEMVKFAGDIVKNYSDSKEMLVTIFSELRSLENLIMPKGVTLDHFSKNPAAKSRKLGPPDDQIDSASDAGFDQGLTEDHYQRRHSLKSEPGSVIKERFKQKFRMISKSASVIGEKTKKERPRKTKSKGREDSEYPGKYVEEVEIEGERIRKRRTRSKSAGNIKRYDTGDRSRRREDIEYEDRSVGRRDEEDTRIRRRRVRSKSAGNIERIERERETRRTSLSSKELSRRKRRGRDYDD
ncbi:transient receptor potential cation channel subfamily A member 1-like isoform X2 [Dendronephthya gigantea]|nr:transient receptor potential cation channel subfamily A member 1-like isoform X2 [Dendronephthya gigantea]